MDWNKDKSLSLSKICVGAFALLLLAADIGAYWMVRLFVSIRPFYAGRETLFLILIYVLSVFAWIALWQLWQLACAMQKGLVFTEDNIRRLRIASWCCAGVALTCLIYGFLYLPLFVLALAAAFMALIVRIVKNCFEHAVAMKSELDLTI